MAKNSEPNFSDRTGRVRNRCLIFGIPLLLTAFLVVHPTSLAGQGLSDGLSRLRATANSNPSKPDAAGSQDPASEGDSASETLATSTTAFGSAPFDLDMLGPLFLDPPAADTSGSAPNLREEAERSFLAGDQAVALGLMFGHMVGDYDSAQSLLRTVKWSNLLVRPVWNIRFGVSMQVREIGPVGDDANPIPVGGQARAARPAASGQLNSGLAALGALRGLGNQRARGNSRGRPGANANPGGGLKPLGSTPNAAGDATTDRATNKAANQKAKRDLDETLGLVAQVVGEEFTTRYERGDFGPLLINVSEPDLDAAGAGATNRPLPGLGGGLSPLGGNRAPAANPAAPAPARNQTLPRLGGGGLQPLSGNRPPAAQPPAASAPSRTPPQLGIGGLHPLRSNPTPPPQLRPSVANSTAPTKSDAPVEPTVLASPDSLPMWKPGIVFVGSGGTKEMIKRAKDAGLDVLIHFEVTLKSTRNEPVQNISLCRLINVANGKPIGVSKRMDSDEEQQEAAKGNGGRAYVDERIRNLILVLDKKVKVVDLPKMSSNAARGRVGSLLSKAPKNSLRTLAEIRLYQMQQLLTDEEVELAFDMVGGADSLLFLHGSPTERAAVARKWAVKSQAKTGS